MVEYLKRHSRSILLLCLSVAALVGGVLWLIRADYLRMIQNKYFQGPVTSYMGVNIGDTREEVLYKIGKPSYVFGAAACKVKDSCYWNVYDANTDLEDVDNHAPKTEKDFRTFGVYVYADRISNKIKEVSVQFRNNKVRMIFCRNKCESILGVSTGTKESDVYKLIGTPDKESIDPEFGNKTMIYKKFNLTLMLEKRTVYSVSVKRIDQSQDW